MKANDERHGSPYDRGGADFYYGRAYAPHYYVGNSVTSERVEADDPRFTQGDLDAYNRGYGRAEEDGDRKDWR